MREYQNNARAVVLVIWNLEFKFVSDFEFRISGFRTGLEHYRGEFSQNRINCANSLARCSIPARVICVVRFNPNPSQQKEATTLP